ncbi:MAG: Gfo/Idh/MocA family oxidoreductase [Thermoguttaceae bacterium]|jgi:predicted dehydrogenase|nr:Gfo/Idh/MocA family oxidoreductase [Thermoguttaceae bacterium]
MIDGKLGVAIHGAGQVAYAHAASWLKNPQVKIVSVSSRRRQSAERLARKFNLDCTIYDDFDQVIRDDRIDIVNLSGPNDVHTPQGIAAAQAGKHLLMEKPMCLSMDENRALRDAVAKAGVRSVVSFVLRWNPLFQNLKALLAAGAVGRLFYVEVDYWHGLAPWWTGWEWGHTKAAGGSTMLLGGCHAVDAIRWFSGREIVEVAAYGNNLKGNFEFDANVVAILKFDDGSIGKTSALFDAEIPYAFNIDLLGTEGSLRDNRIWSKRLLPGQTGWTTMQTILPDSGAVEHHPFDAEVNHLVDCIVGGHESHCNIADAYHTHEVCIAIDRALATGKPVRLPLD